MNKNNKGFMLLETLIVSTIILSTLIFLFVQFTNIKENYEVSFRYNTIPGIYIAKELSDFLVENNINDSLSNMLDNEENGFINIKTHTHINNGDKNFYQTMIFNMNIKNVLYTSANLEKLKAYLNSSKVDTSIFTESFKEYIFSLKTKNVNNNRLIIMFNDKTFASIIVGIDSGTSDNCSNNLTAECFSFVAEDKNWTATTVYEALEDLRNS